VGLILVALLSTLILAYAQKRVISYLTEISEYKTQSFITSTVNNVVLEELDQGLNYKDIIILNRDILNNITSVETNITKTSKLSAEISSRIQESFPISENGKISIPFGVFLGTPLLENIGPDFIVTMRPYGNIVTDFKSELSSAGLNQTRYRLYVQVKVDASVDFPLLKRKTRVITNIPVTETIVIGKVSELNTEN